MSAATRSKDIWDHILTKHIGHTPFFCTECSKHFSTEMQIRRHLKEVHQKEKDDIEQVIAFENSGLQAYLDEVSASNNNPTPRSESSLQAQSSSTSSRPSVEGLFLLLLLVKVSYLMFFLEHEPEEPTSKRPKLRDSLVRQ